MCCIFTCCGWLIDLIQRLWTFTMSCIISSAVCCSLLTASMSGVALGYNYSLAEYIDLKETNVSIYLKRGIFDDDIADDMDWRRSGHLPISGHIKESNLMTGASDESTTLRSGRRLDDSIYESNDRNNFEGSLMRLTAKAPDPTPVDDAVSSEVPMSEIIKPFQPGSLDQLKAIKSAINMRKNAAAYRRTTKKSQEVEVDSNRRFDYSSPEGRRVMKFDAPPIQLQSSTYNSLRLAVPDDQINDPSKWLLPKVPPQSISKHAFYDDDYMSATYPSPVTPRAGPVRPTRPENFPRRGPPTARSPETPTRSPEPNLPKSLDEEMESFKEKPLLDRFDMPNIKEEDFIRKMKINAKKTGDDYEDEIRGLPLRKRRNIGISTYKANNYNKSKTENSSRSNNIVFKSLKLIAVNDKVDNSQIIKNINIRENHEVPFSKTLTTLGLLSKTSNLKPLLVTAVV